MRYLVVVEEGPTSFGAYVPDLPGCILPGKQRKRFLPSFERPSNCISLTSRRVESLFHILRQRASWSKSRPHNRALHRRAPIVAPVSLVLYRTSVTS